MTHLHGGFVAADSDGNPAVTPNGFRSRRDADRPLPEPDAADARVTACGFTTTRLGTTRLNVFAGLAAAYILRDEFDTGAEPNPIGIPGGPLRDPAGDPGPPIQRRRDVSSIQRATFRARSGSARYFGDVMLVNGKVWPFLEVEPRLYRFRILNGCNARILNLDIGGARMWQIGAEGGLWDTPVPVTQIVLAPAERADVLVDFSALAGAVLPMKNLEAAKARCRHRRRR